MALVYEFILVFRYRSSYIRCRFREKRTDTYMKSNFPETLLPKHKAFLQLELVDRPLLGAWVGGYYPAEQFPRGHSNWNIGQQLEPKDVCFDNFRDDYEALYNIHREVDDDFFYVGSAYWGIPWI